MFERFSERATHICVLAQECAKRNGAAEIGTDNLLWAIASSEPTMELLEAAGVSAFDIDREIRSRSSTVEEHGDGRGRELPFSPLCKRAFELALREALAHAHSYIGAWHLLLGVIRLADGEGFFILQSLLHRQTPDDLRDAVVREMHRREQEQREGAKREARAQAERQPREFPFEDGDVIVLGPEVFASRDGEVIAWKGENYRRASADEPKGEAEDPMVDVIRKAQRWMLRFEEALGALVER